MTFKACKGVLNMQISEELYFLYWKKQKTNMFLSKTTWDIVDQDNCTWVVSKGSFCIKAWTNSSGPM